MLSSFRRLSKSKVGTGILVAFLLMILASFALGDMSNVLSGGGGLSQGTLAKVGSASITEQDLAKALERRLQQARQQKPDATYADIAGDFESIMNGLIQERTLHAFAQEHGLHISKRLIDAEIARIPGMQGLDGRFSEANYQAFLQQQRLTDAQVRREIMTLLLQRLILAPVAANARLPVGVARPYASMLLERREGEVAFIPAAAFRGGPAPTEAEVQQYYRANQARYTVPEQRVLRIARIGPEQLGNLAPTDAEIAAYYNANRATYAGKEERVISRAVIADRNAANQVASRARSGTFAAAAAPAGFSAADVSVGPQTREQLTQLAGAAIAAQVFAAAPGAIVGPVQSDLGWNVIKVEGIRNTAGRSLAQARAEITAKLAAEKRKNGLADLVAKVEDAVAEGQNFAEVAAANRLPIVQTPPLTATGAAPSNPGFKLPPELAGLVRFGFDMAADDDPVVETLPDGAGYALLAPGEVTPAAPAPLAAIRAQVASDLLDERALARARAVANAVLAKVNGGAPLAQAVAGAGVPGLPKPEPLNVRRLELNRFGPQVPGPLRILFGMPAGRARLTGAPEGQGFFIVRNSRITPGNASLQPALISQVQAEFNQSASEEYAVQFLTAAQQQLGVERNEAAIAAARKRLITGG
ncbi:SurA N-terminal domain-containing protein [Sphingomonas sp. GCM10030256]|uniref:peptidylprolyl isomerase n=1 Tax=Sphingomonas sp. GCM10030256 TaxID=3273427 RepID=UPI00360B95EC